MKKYHTLKLQTSSINSNEGRFLIAMLNNKIFSYLYYIILSLSIIICNQENCFRI